MCLWEQVFSGTCPILCKRWIPLYKTRWDSQPDRHPTYWGLLWCMSWTRYTVHTKQNPDEGYCHPSRRCPARRNRERILGRTYERTFFDVGVFNLHAQSNRHTSLPSCYRKHEQVKKHMYEQRCKEVEHTSLTPLVMFSTGGLTNKASTFYKRLACMLTSKSDQPYSSTLCWLHCYLAFSLLCSAIQSIRGAWSSCGHAGYQDPYSSWCWQYWVNHSIHIMALDILIIFPPLQTPFYPIDSILICTHTVYTCFSHA